MNAEADSRIHIREFEVMWHIGVADEEGSFPQRVAFNLTFWPTRGIRELGDDLTRAVDYATVCIEVEKFVGQRRDRLIETLADALAVHLLETFAI